MLVINMRFISAIKIISVTFLLLSASQGNSILSNLDEIAGRYKWDMVMWHANNLPKKWLHLINDLPNKSDNHATKLYKLEVFFNSTNDPAYSQDSIDTDSMVSKRESSSHGPRNDNQLKQDVEEIIEGAIRSVLSNEGLASRFNIIFPPVDTSFENPPKVLILSPREKIELKKAILLVNNMSIDDIEQLEEKASENGTLSTLVIQTGGVATYPSIIPRNGTMIDSIKTAAHEWTHHYLWFHPLGFNYFRTQEMKTINETAANIIANEIAQNAHVVLYGTRYIPKETPNVPEFDLKNEMQATRIHVDDLLAAGFIKEAEDYMEVRRDTFLENGYAFRKMNQAYFAFHGSYADNPASTSPIYDQLVLVRNTSVSLGDFIRTIRDFSNHADFISYVNNISTPTYHETS